MEKNVATIIADMDILRKNKQIFCVDMESIVVQTIVNTIIRTKRKIQKNYVYMEKNAIQKIVNFTIRNKEILI